MATAIINSAALRESLLSGAFILQKKLASALINQLSVALGINNNSARDKTKRC